jgi:Tfp pilus assembly protein PilN
MLNINLVPENVRKTDTSSLQQFHRAPLMRALAGLLVGSAVILLVAVQVRGRQLRSLTEQLEGLAPKKAVIDQLQKLVQALQAEQNSFELLRTRDTAWAKRLSVLSELTPQGVWFTDFVWDGKDGLSIEGISLEEDGAEMGKISRFIDAVKAHASFRSNVAELKVESIQRVQDGEIELVKFAVTGVLAAPEAN